MRWKKISDAVVRRLPLYLRVLEEVDRTNGDSLMSSHELGERAGVSPALVRKDLAWFGEFGKQGVGYEVAYLREEIRRILNLHREVRICLVGVGSLGHALARYNIKRFRNEPEFKLQVAALFDTDTTKIGEKVDGIEIRHLSELPAAVKELELEMGIVTVPAAAAQSVVDMMVSSGIKAILNFAPTRIIVPPDVHVATADLSLELQRLAYYLTD